MERWYTENLQRKSWGNLVDEAADKYGSRTFLIYEGRHITFREFQEQVNLFAKGLLKLGVKKGDVVAIWMTNCPEWLITQYASYKAGAVLTPIYTYFKQPEVEYSLRQADVTTLVMKDSFLKGKINALQILRNLCPEVDETDTENYYSTRFPLLRRIISVDGEGMKSRYDFAQLLDIGSSSTLDKKLRERQSAVDPFDVMNIMFTSGTTGFPKGSLSMHITKLCTSSIAADRTGINEKSVILNHLPVFTNWGSMISEFGLLKGCPVVLTGEPHFDPAISLELSERERVTYITGPTTQFIAMFEHPDFRVRNLSSWQVLQAVGGPYSSSMLSAARELGFQFMNGYGLSECGGLSVTTLLGTPLELVAETLGLPLAHTRYKIINPDTGKRVAGEPGEMWLHDVYPGSCVGKGYYKMPDKTKEAITEDGWFRTGDLLIDDENGYLRWSGRLKDMLKVGGFNVYTAEVEAVLSSHPSIAEVVVVGVPDAKYSEVPVAWILPREGVKLNTEEVIQFAKENLPSYKMPRYVRFYKRGELPVSTTGKPQKFRLTEIARQELGL